jgi:hypothetical protein
VDQPPTKAGVIRSFWLALAAQLSNPKTLIVISAIFAALLPSHIPASMYWTQKRLPDSGFDSHHPSILPPTPRA